MACYAHLSILQKVPKIDKWAWPIFFIKLGKTMAQNKYTFLILLFFFTAFLSKAQEPLEMELIGDSRGYIAMLSLDEDEVLVLTRGEESGTIALCRMKTDGAELEYVAQNHLNENGFTMFGQSLLFQGEDDGMGVIYHKKRADSLWVAVGDIGDDFIVTETGSVLLSGMGSMSPYFEEDQYLIENGHTFVVHYFTCDSTVRQFRIVRFDKWGNVLADRAFASVIFDFDRLFAFNADSTGYLVGSGDIREQPFQKRCYNLDFNLDTTLMHDEIYWDFPLPGWRGTIFYPYIAKHPETGCLYVVGSSGWDTQGNDVHQDAMIARFDPNMSHIDKWELATDTPADDQRAFYKSIDFFPDGSIAMCAMVQYGLYVARFDEDLNKISEVYRPSTGSWRGPFEICALPNGDCVVTTIDDKIYHILADSFWDVDEAHDNGLKVAIAYPNPGKDVLNIRTGLKDARVEVYDMSGRMVYRQEITENITSINAEGWPAGSYVWKVVADTSTGSGTEAESGKWIKE